VLKTVSFVRFGGGHDRREATRRWAEEQAASIVELPGVLRHAQNVALRTPGDASEPLGFDGFSTIWWSDRSSYAQALESDGWHSVIAGPGTDLAWTRSMSAEVEERVMRVGLGANPDGVSTPPPGRLKVVGVLRYLTGMPRGEANEYWLGTHGEIALTVSQLGHYVHNHVLRPLRGETTPLAFDGYSEAWFEDERAFEEALASDGWKSLVRDGPNLFDRAATMAAFVEERAMAGRDVVGPSKD
jgi:uncharacterized protein (TIGR02118 family)